MPNKIPNHKSKKPFIGVWGLPPPLRMAWFCFCARNPYNTRGAELKAKPFLGEGAWGLIGNWDLVIGVFYRGNLAFFYLPIRFFSGGFHFPSFFRCSISLPRTIRFRVRSFLLSLD